MDCIAQLDNKYLELVHSVINGVLQEIMDSESFYDNGHQYVSTEQLLKEIASKTNDDLADIILACVVEFCITNYYPVEKEEEWNFINYFLKHHKNHLTTKERNYLKSLNNSYMSIYKVTSISCDNSVVLKDQIEKKMPSITVFDKAFSNGIVKGSYVAVRAVKKDTTDNTKGHELSSTVFLIPDPVIKSCINVIRNINEAMFGPLAKQLMGLFGNNEVIEDTNYNRLQAKKMWAKQILEEIYLYYSNYTDYHIILDYDGNPWHPCIIEFDVLSSAAKLKKALSSIKEFKYDEECKNGNTWLWLSKRYKQLNSKNIKAKLPAVNENQDKSPLFNGAFIINNYDGESYHIFAEIKLVKNKLIVEVNSKQRANIAQDKILTELSGMVSNGLIPSQS